MRLTGKTKSGDITIYGRKIDGLGLNLITKTCNYTPTLSDDIIICGATSNTIISLPLTSNVPNKIYFIKNVGTGTVKVGSSTNPLIDGTTSRSLSKYDGLWLIAGSTEYHILNRVIAILG